MAVAVTRTLVTDRLALLWLPGAALVLALSRSDSAASAQPAPRGSGREVATWWARHASAGRPQPDAGGRIA